MKWRLSLCMFINTHKYYKNMENVDIIEPHNHSYINVNERKTSPILTKYEKARILGIRAIQISKGAKPTVNIKNMHDALKIAEKEFEEGDIPLIIRRYLPDGTYEDWPLKDLSKR